MKRERGVREIEGEMGKGGGREREWKREGERERGGRERGAGREGKRAYLW